MSPPPPRLSRTAILTEARALITESGRGAFSLRPLGARLGVTAPALYAHFGSKEEMLAAIAEDEFARLIGELEAAVAELDDPLERVRAQFHAYVRYAVANPALFEIIFEFRPAWSPGSFAPELPLASKAFEVSAAAVSDAISASLLHEPDPLLASLTIWAAAHGVATVLAARPQLGDEYEAALVASVVDNVLAGLASKRPNSEGPR
jgi:AcrR family transcriptional regulator